MQPDIAGDDVIFNNPNEDLIANEWGEEDPDNSTKPSRHTNIQLDDIHAVPPHFAITTHGLQRAARLPHSS